MQPSQSQLTPCQLPPKGELFGFFISTLFIEKDCFFLPAATSSPFGRAVAAGDWEGSVYFRRRLSLRVAQKVPALWNTCTMSTSRMTHTIMMSVW